jgi:hypothetical protein
MGTEFPMAEQQQNSLDVLKQNLNDYVRLQLGGDIVDIELDPAHYESAYQKTIGTYRQRAQNAYEESYSFMELVRDVNIYQLPQEVVTVRQIFRRTFGDSTGPFASNFDPFAQASLNVYLMNFNVSGGLATYDFYSQYVELAGRMFGAYMNYTFNPVTKKLQLVRDPRGTGENVLLWTYNLKPEINLLSDFQISQWIKDYMVANCKMIIGEAREKFGTIAGPQGGGTLNGAAMKTEAKEAMTALEDQLKNYMDGSQPLTWVIG